MWIFAQIVIACSMTACFGLNKIRCVTINVETYVAIVKPDDCVWLCGSVVHHNFRLLCVVGLLIVKRMVGLTAHDM